MQGGDDYPLNVLILQDETGYLARLVLGIVFRYLIQDGDVSCLLRETLQPALGMAEHRGYHLGGNRLSNDGPGDASYQLRPMDVLFG